MDFKLCISTSFYGSSTFKLNNNVQKTTGKGVFQQTPFFDHTYEIHNFLSNKDRDLGFFAL